MPHHAPAGARLRELIRVNNDLNSNLDPETLLRRIVEIGTELVHAERGVIVAAGDDTPSLPDSSLHIPIRVGDALYGHLHLADSLHGEFSADDVDLAEALAATAGIAIANARLFEDSLYREKWASALAETGRRLMTDENDEHLDFLIDSVRGLAGADLVCIGLLDPSRADFVIDRAVGATADQVIGRSFAVKDTVVGEAIRAGEPVRIADVGAFALAHGWGHVPLGDTLVISFTIGDGEAGALTLARLTGRPQFTTRDVDMASSFAGHISVAIDRAEARMIRRRMELLEDRSRIARDLHDHVIQRLFATGLNLQAVASRLAPEPARDVTEQIKEVDASIAQIRQSIFALHRDSEATGGLRARVLEIVDRAEFRSSAGPRPQVTFLGPVDLMADSILAADVAAVVTESLANVVRHARATSVDVVVSAVAGRITVEVTDDGTGIGTTTRLSGLANLRSRAEAHGGTFDLLDGPRGGTRLIWSVPD